MTKQEVAPRDGDKRFVQLERELRANEDRWDAVLANPFMGITVLDKNQYFITTNSTFQAMVGYTEDELKKNHSSGYYARKRARNQPNPF